MNLFTQNIAEVSVVYKNTVKASDRPKISCSRDASEIMRNYMNDGNLQIEHREYFFILLLNRANKVLGVSTVSMGGMSGTVRLSKNPLLLLITNRLIVNKLM